MVNTDKLDILAQGFSPVGLGYMYGLKESEMYRHKLSDFLENTIWNRLISGIEQPDCTEYLMEHRCTRSIDEEKKWYVLNEMSGNPSEIELPLELVDHIPLKYTVFIRYNGDRYKIGSTKLRQLTLVLGKSVIPIRYFNKF